MQPGVSVACRWYDVHAHLCDTRLAAERSGILERCEAELGGVLVTAAALGEWEEVAMCARRPRLYGALGVHPWHRSGWQPDSATRLEALLRRPPPGSKLIAVGEIGLDFADGREDIARQSGILAEQLLVGRRLGLPAIVHNRKSWSDFFALLRELRLAPMSGLCHSFSGSREIARQALDCGLALSFSGACTVPAAHRLRELIRYVPGEALLIESDAPDQPPWPCRDSLNLPWRVEAVYRQVAAIRHSTPAELLETVRGNWQRLFALTLPKEN